MLKKTILGLIAGTMMVCGQTNSGRADIAIFPPPAEAFEELKEYLSLSGTQVEQLRDLLNERSNALLETHKQIEEKRTELNTLLRNGSRDVSRIGQLMLDIHTLSTATPPPMDQWRERALAILTAEQRAKLGPLDQAMKLAPPAHQAVTFNLIDPPPPGRPIVLPALTPRMPAARTSVPLTTPLP